MSAELEALQGQLKEATAALAEALQKFARGEISRAQVTGIAKTQRAIARAANAQVRKMAVEFHAKKTTAL